jgi:hypothetical protein
MNSHPAMIRQGVKTRTGGTTFALSGGTVRIVRVRFRAGRLLVHIREMITRRKQSLAQVSRFGGRNGDRNLAGMNVEGKPSR